MKFINLKKFRRDVGLKQKDIVAKTGIPQSALSYLENGYQELTEEHLDMLKQAFPSSNIDEYVYELDCYPSAAGKHTLLEKSQRYYHGDWNKPTPLDVIQGHSILVKMGRINITGEGALFLDKNNGDLSAWGYYYIPLSRLSDSRLLHTLTQKAWFDEEMYEHFKRCYALACSIAGIKPVVQDDR